MSKRERHEKLGDQAKKFKNVFIKNFGDALNEEKLRELFSKYGEITSCVVMSNDDGKSKGFGFVAFESHEAADQVSVFLFIIWNLINQYKSFYFGIHSILP